MPEVSGKCRTHRRITWFDVGASALFVTIGVLLLGRGLWHTIVHHDLMLRSIAGGVLFCTLGTLFARQGLKSKRVPQHRLRGKISKRHRIVKLWILILALVTPAASRAQNTSDDQAVVSIVAERSPTCNAMPIEQQKLEAWKARAKRSSERARSQYVNSVEGERKLGQRLAREVDKNTQFSSDAEAQKYVTTVVQRLALSADAGVPFTVKSLRPMTPMFSRFPGDFFMSQLD